MHADAPHLDGQYAAFGKLTEGFDVLDRIAMVRTNFSDKPLREQKMKSVTIEE
jgi:peptidyl-prolyl cis-trans isomerase B (cyclophilin B)